MEKNDHTAKVETWDKVSETYTEDISDSEQEMGEKLSEIFRELCKQDELSVIELGSGSGHLSAVIAGSGVKTTLVDFSNKALDVSKKLYSKQNIEGQFVCQDLFELEMDEEYDIAWNSGVLEHFSDKELDELIENLRKLKAKYYVIVVPNAVSMPYLLYRYCLESQDSWIWGKEFLRTDYVDRFLKAGFSKIDTFYIGSKYTEYLLNVSLKRKFPYVECVKDGIVSEENHALVGYIFSLDSKECESCNEIRNMDSITALKTQVFELRGKLEYASDIIYALNLKKEEAEKKQENIVVEQTTLKCENDDLKLKKSVLEKEKEDLQKRKESLEKECQNFVQEGCALKEQKQNLIEIKNILEGKVASLEFEKSKLEEKIVELELQTKKKHILDWLK